MATSTSSSTSGWVTFAAVVIVIAGLYNLLSGVAAITESESVKVLNEVLYGIDIEAWGWFWAVIGVAQLITAILLFARSPTGAMLALLGAIGQRNIYNLPYLRRTAMGYHRRGAGHGDHLGHHGAPRGLRLHR